MQFRVRIWRPLESANYWYTDGWYDLETARQMRNDAWKYGLYGVVVDNEGFLR